LVKASFPTSDEEKLPNLKNDMRLLQGMQRYGIIPE